MNPVYEYRIMRVKEKINLTKSNHLNWGVFIYDYNTGYIKKYKTLEVTHKHNQIRSVQQKIIPKNQLISKNIR